MVQIWDEVMERPPQMSRVFSESLVADIDKTKLFVTVLMNLVLVVLISLLFPARAHGRPGGAPVRT